tara:strand:- start:971 stop:1270 length:300 start_codon:yes stop_codon:yes gene_type:complete
MVISNARSADKLATAIAAREKSARSRWITQTSPMRMCRIDMKKKYPKIYLSDHKGHDVVKVNAARRVMYLCQTCQEWLGQKRKKLHDNSANIRQLIRDY